MPSFACPFCAAPTHLPVGWPHPGFTCGVCHRPVAFPPGGFLLTLARSAEASDPHFIPVDRGDPWRWTPWLVFLLGAAAMGSVVAYLLTWDDLWLLAVGAPALGLIALTALRWILASGREPVPLEDEPDATGP
ncbi:hypothetical protein [Gemmata sp.]|uniref:hypothetical protein n=1 Tax=Gemmata sp. TaxID=1914242 RepID=UPI003F71BADD